MVFRNTLVFFKIVTGGCYYNYEDRPNWERSIYGRLALVGATVGYGSSVYFPHHFLKYKIIYLFPYLTILILVGIPLFAFEVAMGQYLNIGPIKGFSSLAPILSGLGWGMVMTTLITTIFYNLYLAYSVIFFISYFVGYNENEDTISDICSFQLSKNSGSSSPWEFYGQLLMIFATCWIIVAFCLSKGYQSSSRMIVFINILPFYLLLILVILKAYYTSSVRSDLSLPLDFWKHILNWPIWLDAFKQVLFTLSIGFGVTSTLASYNKATKHKFLLDVIAVPFMDFAISLLCLYLIYENQQLESESVLFMLCAFAKKMQEDQINVFIYLILFSLGLSCQLSMAETIVIAILDQYKTLRNHHFYVVFIICFLLALSGSYTCISTDFYHALLLAGENLQTIFSLLLALSAPIFCLRFNKIKQDLNLNISKIFESYLRLSWCFFCPVIITFGTIANFVMKKETDQSANIVSALLILISLSFSVSKVWKLKFKETFQPTKDFCLFEERCRPPPTVIVNRGAIEVDVPP